MIMGKNGKIKIAVLLVLCMMTGMVLCGCGQTSTGQKEAGTKCDYTVVAARDCPEEFLKNLEEKKINPFQMTYQDGTYLYMAVGYGEQKTGGYSILVEKLTETKDKIFLNTELRGPSKEETVLEKPSFPYVVIKIENISKEVVFEAH